jgi:hypothetical protein
MQVRDGGEKDGGEGGRGQQQVMQARSSVGFQELWSLAKQASGIQERV